MVWFVAVLIYTVGIAGRTSFGVVGIEALDRYHTTASGLGVFVAIQMGVYALSQVPMGVFIDRFGPRLILVCGALLLAVGQIIVACTTSYGVAVAARVLIAIGDATAFLSVMRILPSWFPLRTAPIFAQVACSIGQMGQMFSALIFLGMVHRIGWTSSFASMAFAGVLIAVIGWLFLQDAPGCRSQIRATTLPPVSAALGSPATWIGFFVHGTGLMPMIVFLLLWGAPLMQLGMGFTPEQSGHVLFIVTICNIVASPILGLFSTWWPRARVQIMLVSAVMVVASWTVVFHSDTPPSMRVFLVATVLMGICNPTTNYAFDLVRDGVSHSILATATGFANMGGFISGMVLAQLYGVLLDFSSSHYGAAASVAATDPAHAYTWVDFRFASISALGVWLFFCAGLLISVAIARRDRGRSRARR